MPNQGEHSAVGAFAGATTAGLFAVAANQRPLDALIEAIGGGLAGTAGGRIPDCIDPPIHPNHRGVGHAVITSGGTCTAILASIPKWQRELRRCSLELRESRAVETSFLGKTILLTLELMCLLVSGGLVGLPAGHASHLLCDAGTAKGLPLFG